MTRRLAQLAGAADWIAVGLAAVTLATRLPFASEMLFSFDSANYAFAVRDYYNVAHHQPHPPGYPLYVAVAKLFDLLVREPNRSLVLVSITAATLAVVFTYWLGREWLGRAGGAAAGLLLVLSPGFWGYSEVAYPYTCLAAGSAIGALACWRMRQGATGLMAWSGVLMGTIAGIRWDSLVFLAPLWALSLRRATRSGILLAAAGLVAAVGGWAAPMVLLSGGWAGYAEALRAQSSFVVGSFSLFGSGGDFLVRLNLHTLTTYLRQSFGLGLLVLVFAIGRMFGPARLAADGRVRFLAVWMIPPLLVYLLIHIGDPGYVLSLAPPASLLVAWTMIDVADELGRTMQLPAGRVKLWPWLAARTGGLPSLLPAVGVLAIGAWGANVFFRAPGPARLPEIRQIDATLRSQVAYVRAQLEPSGSVILAHDRFRQAQYYLRGFDVRLLFDEYRADYRSASTRLPVVAGMESIAVLDEDALNIAGSARGQRVVVNRDPEVALWLIDVRGLRAVEYGYRRVELIP
jgi:hypothetical protein